MKEKDIIKLHQSISTSLADRNYNSCKMRNLITNYLLAVSLLKSVFAELNMEELTASKRSRSNDELMCTSLSESTIEHTLETLNRMAAEGKLIKDVDYDSTRKVDDELCLRLNYTAFYEKFKSYCTDNGINHEVLTLKDFKKELMKKDYCLYYNMPVSFRNVNNIKEFKTFRSAILSIKDLEKQNLKLDHLITL